MNDVQCREIDPQLLHARAHGDVHRQCAQDRPVRRELLVRPRGHHGAGALDRQLGGQPRARPHGRRGRHRVHAAGRALEGLRRRHRLHGHDARDHHLGDRPAGLDQAADRVRHRARAAVSSASSRPSSSSPPTRSARAASGSTSWSAGTRTSSRCSASPSASTRRATTTPRTGSTRSRWPGARRRISISTASSSSSRRCAPSPSRYGGTRPLIMNAGASPTGRAFAIRNCDAFFTQASRTSMDGDRADA